MKSFNLAVPRVLALALASSLLAAPNSTHKESPPAWFWGCWIVKKALPISGVVGISPKQEKAIIGTRIMFAPTCARWRGTVLKSPKYSVKVLSADKFFDIERLPLSEIGVRGEHVTEVEVDLPGTLSDLDFIGAYTYLRNRDIVLEVEGDCLLAEKAKPGDPKCECESPRTK